MLNDATNAHKNKNKNCTNDIVDDRNVFFQIHNY